MMSQPCGLGRISRQQIDLSMIMISYYPRNDQLSVFLTQCCGISLWIIWLDDTHSGMSNIISLWSLLSSSISASPAFADVLPPQHLSAFGWAVGSFSPLCCSHSPRTTEVRCVIPILRCQHGAFPTLRIPWVSWMSELPRSRRKPLLI